MTPKACTKCGDKKPLEQFDKDSRNTDGRRERCKQCRAAYRRAGHIPRRREPIRTESEKRCPKCGEWKPLDEYYKNRHCIDGLRSYCKVCDAINGKLFSQTAKGKAAARRRNIKQRERYPERAKARSVICNAVAHGTLPAAKALGCQDCSAEAEQYHHPNYADPLHVIALCRPCHRKHHKITSSE